MSDNDTTPQDRKWLYWVGGGMLLGTAIGSVLGLTILDNIAIGAGIGMIFGIVIGSAIHAFRKH
jgi:hypothetical protein